MIKRLIVVCMTCLSLLFVHLGQASIAWAEAAVKQTYEMSLSDTNISLSGVVASKQVFFQIPDYWKVGDVKLNLDYKASPLTKNERSSVTLLLNGTYFHSFRPAVNDMAKQRLTFTIPKELVIKGNNTLSIEGNIQTVSELGVCMPYDPKDNWLQLYSTSTVSVQYEKEAMKESISDFTQQFIGLDTVHDSQNAIAVPEQSDPVELEASVYALSGFAKANSLKEKAIPLLTYNTEKLNAKKIVMAVALYDHLPEELKKLVGVQDLSNKALIQVVNRDKQPTLVITSQNPDLLVKAGRLAANQALMKQLNSGTKVVDESTEIETPTVDISRNVTLTENGDQLKGPQHQDRTYFISLPANRSIADSSKISLDFRYAKNLDFKRSMVTILVNNTPIGSKKLKSELANGDTLTLTIPKNLNISGNFTVTASFDLELENAACTPNQEQMPWAFITKDSMLQLNTKDRTDLLFNNYPYPFLRDGSYNQVAVVLPEARDAYTYQTISNLFNLLGQYAEGNTGNVRFYEDSVGAGELQKHNIIAIGTYQNNKVIRDNNSKLYFQYDSKGKGFRSNEKMSIDSDYGARIGTLQLIDSPYEEGHGLLTVTGASSEYYYLASKLIANENTRWKVYGDGVVTDKDGNINAYRFKKETGQEQSSIISDVVKRGDVLGFMAAAVLITVLVLVSLILMIRKYRKKRRESDEA